MPRQTQMWVTVFTERFRRWLRPAMEFWGRAGLDDWLPLSLLVLCFGMGLTLSSSVTVRMGNVSSSAAENALQAELDVVVLAAPFADGGAVAQPVPLPGARVRVLLEDSERRYHRVGAADSDAEGLARLRGLPEGSVWVLVDAEGYARASRAVTLFGERRIEVELLRASDLSVTVVDEEEEKPIVGATVLVDDRDALPFGGVTDAQGRKRFSRLGSAPFEVEVFARGYESARRDHVTKDQRFVLRRLGSLDVHVVSANGDPATGAQVFVVGSTLWPARRATTDASGDAMITGLLAGVYTLKAQLGSQVSPELSGVSLERAEHKRVELRLNAGRTVAVLVVDESPGYDEPIEGARVVLAEYGLSSFPISAVTGKDGFAYLGPVPMGPAFVSVSADDFVPRGAVPVPPETTEPVRVALLRGATLLGEVTDELGRPIDGASVEVIGTDLDGLPINATPLLSAYQDAHFEWSLRPLPLLAAGELGVTSGPVPFVNEALSGQSWTTLPADYVPWITDYEGDFRAFPVPPGKVRALVRHPAYIEGLSEAVTLAPGGEAKVKVVLSAGGELLGRVVDEGDRPVPLARIRVTATKGSFERTSYALEDGTFTFSAVPEEVTIMLARPDDPTRFVTRTLLKVSRGKTEDVELVLPEERDPISIHIDDPDGNPIELAQVQVTSLDPDVPLRSTRFSDVQGQVDVEDAEGLKVRVQVTAPGFLPFGKQFDAAPEELEVVLERGVLIRGRVTSVRGRSEVAGARVELRAGSRREMAYTDALGRYEFKNISEGPVSLSVTHEGLAQAEREMNVEATERLDRAFEIDDIDLAESAALSGVVVDVDGNPVRGARIGLGFAPAFVVAGRLPEGFVLTDASGRFEIRAVEPGARTLSAYADGIGRGALDVDVEEGDDENGLRVVLDAIVEEEDPNLSGGGIALTLGERDTNDGVVVVIVDVTSGGEAQHSGLRPGDLIIEIDGVAVSDMQDARSRLNGKVGSDVLIAVERGDEAPTFRVRREPVGR